MPRPKRNRMVHQPPLFADFKPSGVPRKNLKTLTLELDEYEAIRLADLKGLDQVAASKEMGISRPVFTRLIEAARQKTARFFVEGRHLQIGGGAVHFRGDLMKCFSCNEIFRRELKASLSPGTGKAEAVPSIPCPRCGSNDVQGMAENFGHGRCCQGAEKNQTAPFKESP